MPKPPLRRPYDQLCDEIVGTMLAGHHRYRPDLPYPESHSDMQGAVEGLLMMYEVKRRPLAVQIGDLRVVQCPDCGVDRHSPGRCERCTAEKKP